MTSLEIQQATAKLAALVKGQAEVAAELKPAVLAKQEVLVKHRLTELQQAAEREQALASRLAQLEAQRIAATGELQRALAGAGGLPEDTTLAQLLEYMPQSAGHSELAEAARELDDALRELHNLNFDNGHLTQNLLNYTGMVMRLLTQGTTHPSYGASGRLADGRGGKSIVDITTS